MKPFAFVSIFLAIAAGSDAVSATLSFDEAVALAARNASASTSPPFLSESVRFRSRLPNVRAEVMANASRTLDLFAEGPIEVRSASSILAFDYPIWGRGLTGSRLAAVEARLRRLAERGGLDDARFTRLLDVFGELYFAQRQSEIVRRLSDQLAAEARRSARLLEEGEASNLTAAERRDVAVSFAARLVDLEARRRDAAMRLRQLTGVEGEPTLLLDLSEPATEVTPGGALGDDLVKATTIAVEEGRARLRSAGSSSGLGMTLSGFVGIGAAASQFRRIHSDGSFGVYGLRVHLSYPLLGGSTALSVAEARADVEQSMASRQAAIEALSARAFEYLSREETARKRIALLRESVATAQEREESMRRLVSAGVRSESDLTYAHAERMRREGDLLAAEIERWKAARLIARVTAAEPG